MSLDQFVDFQINVNSSGVPRAGFGLIGIMTYKTVFSQRSRLYSKSADAVSDGYLEDDVEIRMMKRIMSQAPRPTNVAFIRGTLPPTQSYTLGATAEDNTEYDLTAVGEGFADTTATFKTATAASKGQIHASLITQLNAVASKNYLATPAALVYADKVFTATNADEIFHATAHGLKDCDGPFQVSNAGGGLPSGLAAVTDYWVIAIDANTFYLASSLANAIARTHVSITTDGTGTQTLADTVNTKRYDSTFTIVGSAAGEWFSLEVGDVDLMSIVQDHADPGIATDLDAIILRDNTWYWLETAFHSKAMVLAEAEWVEGNGKVYMPAVNDSAACTVAVGDSPTDTMFSLLGLGYKRTEYQYHSSPASFLDAGMGGLLAPKNPGLWTAKNKTPVGVKPCNLNPTHTANILARRGNSITFEGGRSVTWEGQVANATYGFFDVVVSLDWVSDAVRKAIFGAEVSLDKVSYTDEDFAVFEAAVNGVILEAISATHKIMAPGTPDDPTDPPPRFTLPRVADIDPSVRALREVPNGQLVFRLAGAAHKVFITATVSF